MNLHVEPITGLWFAINATTLVLTFFALTAAWRDFSYARTDDSASHEVRELTAAGNVRREVLRVLVQLILLSFVIPALQTDRPVELNPFVAALIAIAILLFLSTYFDRQDRNKLAGMLLNLIQVERSLYALETTVRENIGLTKLVGEKADAAYHEANTVNEKIATLTERLGHKEDKPGEL